MKILIAHSDKKLPARQSIDLWRVIRPFRELQKHVDWQIDTVPYLLPEELFDAESKVDTDALMKEIERLRQYDIIWSSYFPDAVLFDVMGFMAEKYGTKFVLDCDDDMFHIPAHNNIWNTTGYMGIKALQYMVSEAPYLVTSSDNLKAEFEKHRSRPTYLLPNFVGNDFKHKAFDNKDAVVIGYFGSVTHKKDLSETGFLEALQQIMHKYKNVNVLSVGIPMDYYLPKERYTFHPGKPGQAWLDEIWPNINCDIAVAPLKDTLFNISRSNIKWLETAMIPAAFIGSNIEPYKGTVKHGITGLLTDNSTEGWYEALEKLVLDTKLRKYIAANAKREVKAEWHIQKKWTVLKDIIEQIYNTTA